MSALPHPLVTTPASRVPVQMGLKFRKVYGRSSGDGKIRNISMTGAFLEHEMSLHADDRVVLDLQLGSRSRRMVAKVIWQNEIGCGLQFQPENNQDKQLIDDLIYFVSNRREKVKGVLDQIFTRIG